MSIAALLCAVGIWICGDLENDDDVSLVSASPNGRVEWRSMMRSHDLSPEQVFKARDNVRAKMEKETKRQKDAGLNKWTELGPTGVGGRVRAIAIHPSDPDIIFLGGVSGGIWKSNNGGSSWVPRGDMLPSLAITSILIHPTHPDTMYASTGEGIVAANGQENSQRQALPGAGIYKSIDGGNTWNIIDGIHENNQAQFYWVNKLVWDPSDYSSLFAVTKSLNIGGTGGSPASGTLYKVTGDGAVVSPLYTALGTNGITDIDVFPSSDVLYIGTSAGGAYRLVKEPSGQYVLDVDGASQIAGIPAYSTPPFRAEVAISSADTDVVYMLCESDTTTFGTLYKSTDSGDTWIEKDMLWNGSSVPIEVFKNGGGANQGWYNNTIWVDPNNDNKIIIGGIELWKSVNGGDTFIKMSDGANYDQGNGSSPHVDHHIIVESSDYSTSNKKVYFGNDGGIASTDNYEINTTISNWNLINNNLSITQFYHSDIYGSGASKILAGAQDNSTTLSLDNGSTWDEVSPGDGGYCAISKQDPNLMYSSSQRGFFYTTCYTAPFTGEFIAYFDMADYEGQLPFIAPMDIFPNDGEQIIIGGKELYHVVYDPLFCTGAVTTVSPRDSIDGVFITAIDINLTGTFLLVGYSNGEVWLGGTSSWGFDHVYTDPDGRTVTDISINPLDESKVAFSLGGYSSDNVFISANFGLDWTARSTGVSSIHINTLAWHPEKASWLYAGTDLGVFSTENNGQSWNVSPNYNGVSDGPVFTEITNLQFTSSSVLGGHTLVATTYGRGIWKTNNHVYSDVYIDEDYTNVSNIYTGRSDAPFNDIHDAEDIQAHGQKWNIDGGTYPTSSSVILDKRLGNLKLTGTGAVIIGEN